MKINWKLVLFSGFTLSAGVFLFGSLFLLNYNPNYFLWGYPLAAISLGVAYLFRNHE